MSYIDIVAVRYSDSETAKIFLFQAPAWTNLKPGDEVLCETSCGQSRGHVLAVDTMGDDSDEYNLVLTLNRGKQLPKIRAKIIYHTYEYADEQPEEENKTEE